jgi:molecular chaperone DnaK
MYKKASATGGGDAAGGPNAGADAGEGNGGGKPDEKVVDAEFEEVDKDKK